MTQTIAFANTPTYGNPRDPNHMASLHGILTGKVPTVYFYAIVISDNVAITTSTVAASRTCIAGRQCVCRHQHHNF